MKSAVVKTLFRTLRILWWIAAAAIPIAQHRFYESYRKAIECPDYGDCYTDGAEHLLGMELLFTGSALVLWPLCAWYLVIGPWLSRRSTVNPAAPASGVRPPFG